MFYFLLLVQYLIFIYLICASVIYSQLYRILNPLIKSIYFRILLINSFILYIPFFYVVLFKLKLRLPDITSIISWILVSAFVGAIMFFINLKLKHFKLLGFNFLNSPYIIIDSLLLVVVEEFIFRYPFCSSDNSLFTGKFILFALFFHASHYFYDLEQNVKMNLLNLNYIKILINRIIFHAILVIFLFLSKSLISPIVLHAVFNFLNMSANINTCDFD